MTSTDVIIIGAGLMGCFTARQLMKYELGVIVLEKENDVCRGISKANTGIIYPGYDNRPGSNKSRLCVQASEAFDRLCEELGVPFNRPGSLMVSYGPKADEVIRKKYEDGIAGGVKGIRILSGAEAEAMEPSLRRGISSALYSETTGTVDPWELCIAAYENAGSNGADFRFGCEVTGIGRTDRGFAVYTGGETYEASAVVNAAGLHSADIREMVEAPLIRLRPTAADYIVLDRDVKGGPKHIIFHEGEDGKGLTLVPAVDGSMLVGPTKREADEEEVLAQDMRTSAKGFDTLHALCSLIAPDLDLGAQIRTFGSLRPDPYHVYSDEDIKDFSVTEDEGLFSLIGIKTPGLTFANELGRIVAETVSSYLGKETLREDFDPCRKAIVRARDLSLEKRAELAGNDPDYGIVVCRCMDVTKAEIRQAAERGARSFEAVKYRTGAGMGRCQGSRCRKKIMEIIDGLCD